MLEVSLEEVGIETLRKEAQRLGIATDGLDREQLISKIRTARQCGPVEGILKRIDPTILSIVAIAIAVLAMLANWWEAFGTIGQLQKSIDDTNRQMESELIETWQSAVVYSIVEKNDTLNEKSYGVSFEEIRSQYLDEVMTLKDFELPRKEIQPIALQKTLMSLIRDGMVFQTHDDRFMVNRSEPLPGFGRLTQTEKAGYDILHVLTTEKGKYDDQRLQTRIIEKFNLTPQEYRFLITFMTKESYVIRGEDGILYSASDPPRPAGD